VQEAARSAEALREGRLQARAALARVLVRVYAPNLLAADADDEQAIVSMAISTLERARDHAGLARAWRIQAMLSSRSGRYDDVARAAERLIENAGAAGEDRLVARGAAGYANQAVWSSQPVAELTTRIEAFLEQVRGDRKAEANISLALAQLRAMQGEFDRARSLYQRGQTLVRELGPSISAITTSIASARVELLAGDLDAAEAELRRDDAELAQLEERYYRSSIAGALARVLLLKDRLTEAELFTRLAEDIADPEDTDPQVMWRAVRARILAGRGDVIDALRLADEAVALTEETEDVLLKADVLTDRAAVLRAAGRLDDASRQLVAALELYERKGDVVSADRTRSLLEAGMLEAPLG
jgi:ATP/maltotriose-dependent transcriptional regulator MalT